MDVGKHIYKNPTIWNTSMSVQAHEYSCPSKKADD